MPMGFWISQAHFRILRCKLYCDVVNYCTACCSYVIRNYLQHYCRNDQNCRAVSKASQICSQVAQFIPQVQLNKKPPETFGEVSGFLY